MLHDQALHTLQNALHAIRQNRLSAADFCRIWRAQSSLLSALPSRYAQVLEDLLGRLETGSLFSEESCSFSQIDLLANLDVWLDKAQLMLAKTN